MKEHYLDNSATTQPYEAVVEAMARAMREEYGNPSALHHRGYLAERALNSARDTIASTLKCSREEIYFTSSGTEADNLAIFGTVSALGRLGDHVVVSSVEHPAVYECMKELERRGLRVDYIPILPDGSLDLDFAAKVIGDKTILVSCMLVNNELGTIFPIAQLKKLMEKAGSPGYLHCDCVQGYGKLPITAKNLGADLIAISAHKIHGPKGVGALYVKKGVRLIPVTKGGGQERGLRSGTENTYGIIGFAAAAHQCFDDIRGRMQHIAQLKAYTIGRTAEVENCVVNSPEHSAPHILHLSLPGLRSETMLHLLESQGVYVSAGSACSAKSGKPSRVLQNAGLSPALSDSALRISFGDFNTKEDCDALIDGLKLCRQELRGKA